MNILSEPEQRCARASERQWYYFTVHIDQKKAMGKRDQYYSNANLEKVWVFPKNPLPELNINAPKVFIVSENNG